MISTAYLFLGDVILEEKPLVSSQFSWNKLYNYTACEYCMKSIEHAQNMARRLSTKYDLELPYLEQCCDVVQQTTNFVQCPQCKVRMFTLFSTLSVKQTYIKHMFRTRIGFFKKK